MLCLTKFALDQSQSLKPQLRNDFREFPHLKKFITRWWFRFFLLVSPRKLGKISNLKSIVFQMGGSTTNLEKVEA